MATHLEQIVSGYELADKFFDDLQEATEAFDLVKLKAIFWVTNFDPVFLDQEGYKIATIVFAIPLDAANFVKER